jgi:CheY-like chemotaxis protein
MSFWIPVITATFGQGAQRAPVIVVADDDRDTRELYRACFDMCGFVTAEASTGEEALLAAERLKPDVLLTDLIFPDIDGLTIARRLKERPSTASIRVILLTGATIQDFQRKAAEAGVLRALLKPCLPDVMLREVRRALRGMHEA